MKNAVTKGRGTALSRWGMAGVLAVCGILMGMGTCVAETAPAVSASDCQNMVNHAAGLRCVEYLITSAVDGSGPLSVDDIMPTYTNKEATDKATTLSLLKKHYTKIVDDLKKTPNPIITLVPPYKFEVSVDEWKDSWRDNDPINFTPATDGTHGDPTQNAGTRGAWGVVLMLDNTYVPLIIAEPEPSKQKDPKKQGIYVWFDPIPFTKGYTINLNYVKYKTDGTEDGQGTIAGKTLETDLTGKLTRKQLNDAVDWLTTPAGKIFDYWGGTKITNDDMDWETITENTTFRENSTIIAIWRNKPKPEDIGCKDVSTPQEAMGCLATLVADDWKLYGGKPDWRITNEEFPTADQNRDGELSEPEIMEWVNGKFETKLKTLAPANGSGLVTLKSPYNYTNNRPRITVRVWGQGEGTTSENANWPTKRPYDYTKATPGTCSDNKGEEGTIGFVLMIDNEDVPGTNGACSGTGQTEDQCYDMSGKFGVYVVIDPKPFTEKYTITFNGNGGTPVSQSKTTETTGKLLKSNLPANPTRTDYIFDGWFKKTNTENEDVTVDVNTSFCDEESRTLYAKWKYATPTITIDYVNEKLMGFVGGSNYTITASGIATNITTVTGQTEVPIAESWFINGDISIVKTGEGSVTGTSSGSKDLTMKARPAKPTGINKTDESSAGVGNGTITGLTSVMEYKLVSETSYKSVGTSTTLTGLSAGAYKVRIAAVAGTSFASLPVDVTIGVGGLTPEVISPDIAINYTDEKLINLKEKSSYTISGDGVTTKNITTAAGEVAKIIAADWFGKTISIVKDGDATATPPTSSSAAQDLVIPARPAAPAVDQTNKTSGIWTKDVTSLGGSNGEINKVDNTMEWKLVSATAYTAINVTATKVENLVAGAYKVRYKAVAGTSFASPDADVTIGTTGLQPEETPNFTINYQEEKLTKTTDITSTYTVSGIGVTTTSFTTTYPENSTPIPNDWFGTTISIVKNGNNVNTSSSAAQNITIPARPATPIVDQTNGIWTTPVSISGTPGTITGVNSTMQWKASSATTYNDITGTNVTVTGLVAGTYNVRIAPVNNVSFASLDATVTVGTASLTQEVINPPISISYSDAKLINLNENSSYAISGTGVTTTSITTAAGETDKIIAADWFGKTISIIKNGNGTTTSNSIAQSLSIPARPAAPTGLASTDVTTSGGSDGTITGVTTAMEYKLFSTTVNSYTDVTGTTVTGLPGGDYKVRYKATATDFASVDADVMIDAPSKIAFRTTPSGNGISVNGVTATGVITPTGDQKFGTSIKVTITLVGTAAAAGVHTVGLTSATLTAKGITIAPPAVTTKSVSAGAGMEYPSAFEFTFNMPAGDVTDLVVVHTADLAQTYPVAISTNTQSINGLTADGLISPTGKQAAGASVKVTVTLSGTAEAAGTHTIGLSSKTLNESKVAIAYPTTATKTVAAGEDVSDVTFEFTFTMPANGVEDLTVVNTFVPAGTQTYAVGFTTQSVGPTSGLTAKGVVSPTGNQAAGNDVTVTVTLTGTPTTAGTYTIGLKSTILGSAGITPASFTRVVSADDVGKAVTESNAYVFTFTMPAKVVNDLIVSNTFAAAPAYAVGFKTNNVSANGMIATGAITPTGSQLAGKLITVKITLTGTPTKSGTHTIELSSAALVNSNTAISSPATVTKTVTAGVNDPTGNTFEFTFVMPDVAVTDLVVTNSFVETGTGLFTVSFATGASTMTANGLIATGVISPAGDQASGAKITVTVTLTGTPTAAGIHTIGLTSTLLGSSRITAPATVTKIISASDVNKPVTSSNAFVFTFTMPSQAVNDLTVTNVFKADLAGSVAISGTPEVGEILTAIPDITLSTPGTLSYVWNANGAAIAGATASAYTLTRAELGKTITVTVTAANYRGSLTSAPTTAVKATWEVTFSAGSGGDIGAQVDGVNFSSGNKVQEGKTIIFTAAPNAADGYVVKSWKVNGVAQTSGLSSDKITLTLTNVNAAKDVTVEFEIKPFITITAPPQSTTVKAGYINEQLDVEAVVVPAADLTYQWYSATNAAGTQGTKLIADATKKYFPIPTDLTVGTYYYYVEVSSGTLKQKSQTATVTVVNAVIIGTSALVEFRPDKVPDEDPYIHTPPAAHKITITNNGNSEITNLTLSASDNSNYTVSAPSSTTLTASGNGKTATFSVRPKAGLGVGTYPLTIIISGDYNGETVSVMLTTSYTVTLESEPIYRITANPPALTFGSKNEPYTPETQRVVIQNTGTDPVTLFSPTLDNGYYDIWPLSTTTLAAGASATFNVRPRSDLTAEDDEETPYDDMITIGCDKCDDDVQVDLFFSVKPKLTQRISVSPLTSFGYMLDPSYARPPVEQEVTVTNDGTDNITVSKPTAVKYTIVSTWSTKVLKAGESATFTVQPKTGLGWGTHDEPIPVVGKSGSVTVSDTLWALFTVASGPVYAITLDPNGGEVTTALGNNTLNTSVNGKLTSLPSPKYEGNTFDGWFLGSLTGPKVTLSTEFKSDTTIIASWTPDTPNETSTRAAVTFSAGANGNLKATVDGGAIATGALVQKGKTVVLTATADSGYSLVRWTINGVVDANNTAPVYIIPNLNAATVIMASFDVEVSVKSNDRIIPDKNNEAEAAVIAPVAKRAVGLTAGSNVVSRSSGGAVSFFRNGSRVLYGTLYVFDASGSVVKKIPVIDNAVGSHTSTSLSDRRKVSVWNLRDSKGRIVPEGTYVVKGVLRTPGGTSTSGTLSVSKCSVTAKAEKVSVVVGVGR